MHGGGRHDRGGGAFGGSGAAAGRSLVEASAPVADGGDTADAPGWVTHREPSWEELVAQAEQLGRDGRFARLSDAEVEDELAVGAARIDAATCRFLELLGELVVRGVWVEQGARTPGAWLSWRLGIAPSTAREQVRVALRLREFPAVRARFAAGTLSYSKVRAITRCGVPEAEELLLAWADDATAQQLERISRGWRTAERARHEAGTDAEDASAAPGCSVRARASAPGRRTLTITGPEEDIAAIEDDVRRLAEALVADRQRPAPDGAGGVLVTAEEEEEAGPTERDDLDAEDGRGATDDLAVPDAPPRITARDQLDALASTLAAAAAAVTPPDTTGLDRHTLVLHTSVDDAAAALDAVAVGSASAEAPDADVAGVGGASAAAVTLASVSDDHGRVRGMDRGVLRRLLCDAGIVVVAEQADGSPLDVGRRRRRATAALRRAVQRRDRCCTFPGCGATRHLHAHHVQHWTDGGPTDPSNLVLLCGFHHRFVHAQGWRIEVRPDGRHRYRPPQRRQPLPWIGQRPTASAHGIAAAAPPTASAASLLPATYDGSPYDLDTAVAALQRYHEAARDHLDVAV